MFSFCCGGQEAPKKYPSEILVEYNRRDHQSGKFEAKIDKYIAGKIDPDYQSWKRLKFKSKHKNQLANRSYFHSFTDQQFPHVNASLSCEEIDIQIKWKRISDIIEMPIYATAETFNNFDRLALNNKVLKEALLFIKRTHPIKFKQILAHDLESKGIYEFKLYYKGCIENIIIDDYVPVVGNSPFACGPINQKEVFPMLIEKALAKACGAYDKIPTDIDEMLEMLFCGPLRKTKLNELSDKQKVVKNIEQTLRNKGVGGFISKKQSKIRNFGINQNQLYNIIEFYEIYLMDTGEKVHLIELVSEKKLVAWNGKYSHNDQIWDKVDPIDHKKIFNSFKQNKSFCVIANDIPRIFDSLILFDGTQIANKDWIEHYSEINYPSFCHFEFQESDTIFIRQCTKQTVRTSIILAKIISANNYKFQTGSFLQNTESLELCKRLGPGRYIICIFHDWVLDKIGNYTLFISSNVHTSMTRAEQQAHPNFLQHLFKQHSEIMRMNPDPPKFFSWNKFYSICQFSEETGFAYLYIQLKDCKNKQIKVNIDERVLQENRWQLLQPHTGRAQIILDQNNNQQVLLILKAHKYLTQKKMFFPSTAFVIQN